MTSSLPKPAERVFAAAEATLGYTRKQLCGKSRKRHLVDRRHLLFAALRGEGYTYPQIQTLTGCHYSTAVLALHRLGKKLREDPVLLEDAQRFLRAYRP